MTNNWTVYADLAQEGETVSLRGYENVEITTWFNDEVKSPFEVEFAGRGTLKVAFTNLSDALKFRLAFDDAVII